MRQLGLLLFFAGIGCTPTPGSGTDSAARDAGTEARDAGFDPTSLAPCTLIGTSPALALPALVSSGPDHEDAMEQRTVYVLLVLRVDPEARAAIDADASLSALATERARTMHDAIGTCGDDAVCLRDALAMTPAELETAIDDTVDALAAASRLDEVAVTLRASHVLTRFDADTDEALVRRAMSDAVLTTRAALDAYGVRELPAGTLAEVVEEVDADAAARTWWEPLVQVAIAASIRGERDEAVRYEPLVDGENAAALAAIPSIDWAAFPFAAMLVPGQGPNDPDTVLHPGGRMRADLAADRWHAGLAPLVVLSGGHVHPDRTRYAEAIEMKRYLVTTRGVPETAILVDPYARHTTTNLRNVTRVLLRAGVSPSARILVVSDLFQTAYVRSERFAIRCDEELFYRPYEALEALSSTDTCMTMTPQSLTVDASDWLDP